MKKTDSNSIIEIWSVEYINQPKNRNPEDYNKVIIQIEPTADTDMYIVEVINNEEH